MTYRVNFITAAARQVKTLPRQVRDRILEAVEQLGNDPRPQV